MPFRCGGTAVELTVVVSPGPRSRTILSTGQGVGSTSLAIGPRDNAVQLPGTNTTGEAAGATVSGCGAVCETTWPCGPSRRTRGRPSTSHTWRE
jgi:hypothetical protein